MLEFRENQLSENYGFIEIVNEFLFYFPHLLKLWVKFDITHVHIRLLSVCDFSENRRWQRCIFLLD
jgi:hypothetical protein